MHTLNVVVVVVVVVVVCRGLLFLTLDKRDINTAVFACIYTFVD